jgi:PQQ-dependent catabolism-associated CXXCW motif protein
MRALLSLALVAASLSALAETIAPAPEPKAYRMEAYRAPTPATLQGARVIDTQKAFDLWRAVTAAFIDALPHAPKPEGLPKDAVWREQPRFDIPGSLWLPDTGFGALSDATLRYFEKGLEKASGGDKKKPLVFYCLKDCWMSWNAAKRALELGYASVLWYPDGTDGWAAAKHPLEERKPEPREK